jgi:hypothetical protein
MEATHTLNDRPGVRFGLHYLEMVAVMFGGMLVLGGALLAAAAALGFGPEAIESDAPILFVTGMGVSMTVPMVAWMRFRGHSWAANRAMAAAMIVPSLAAIALLLVGSSDDTHGPLMLQHTAMLPAMLVAMLPYRREFTGHRDES